MRNTKLELTWPGKENRPRLEPRILVEETGLSYHAKERVTEGDVFDNVLIHGDNLLALKALTEKVKCVFIDPPYNTGFAFAQYDDGLEHSIWLSMMRNRLLIIKDLLCDKGSLWVTLDDNEAHYFRVMADEVFGRGCFVCDIAWRKRDGAPNDRKIGSVYDHLIVYGRTRVEGSKQTLAEQAFNLMPRTEKADEQYQLYEEPFGFDDRGPFRKVDTTANAKGGRFVQSLTYGVINPYSGETVYPRKGRCWAYNEEDMARLNTEKRLFWGKNGTAGTPMRKLFKDEAKPGMTAPTIWDDAGLNQHAAQEMEEIFGEKAAFETPKPEALLRRVIEIATNPGDTILDSFAGSGTTGAVAQKMGRRWIMVELGDHAVTHIVPRMRKVADGTDQGGISKAVDWKGGGGFRFYRLAPSLLKEDRWGQYVINPAYNPEMLARAACLHEGYAYAPSETEFWIHGRANESSYLYVTTQHLTPDQLQALSDEVGPNRALRVLCTAFSGGAQGLDNLEVKKIPSEILGRCEWDHDDYSLQVANLPMREETPAPEATPAKGAKPNETPDLFGAEDVS